MKVAGGGPQNSASVSPTRSANKRKSYNNNNHGSYMDGLKELASGVSNHTAAINGAEFKKSLNVNLQSGNTNFAKRPT